MKILIASKFLHYVGGVETYLHWQTWALHDRGVEVGLVGMEPPPGREYMDLPSVPRWTTANRSYAPGAEHRALSAAMSVWSPEAGSTMKRALAEFKPDLVHFHGTCYQLTPSVVRATTQAGVPVVLTAHEYKLMCANQNLLDDQTKQICRACVGASARQKFAHTVGRACMKQSRAVSLLGATEQLISAPTWRRAEPVIVTPSRFMRDQLVQDGWDGDRIHYLDLPWRQDDQVVSAADGIRDSVLFMARLAPMKGPHRLLNAWSRVASDYPDVTLRMAGEGEQEVELKRRVTDEGLPRVEFLGQCSREQLTAELSRARVSAHPSQNCENSPFSVRESLMAGVPALVSRVGGMPEMIGPQTGWSVPFDDDAAWAEGLRIALDSRIAGTPALIQAVTDRSLTDGAHLKELFGHYRWALAEAR